MCCCCTGYALWSVDGCGVIAERIRGYYFYGCLGPLVGCDWYDVCVCVPYGGTGDCLLSIHLLMYSNAPNRVVTGPLWAGLFDVGGPTLIVGN